MDEYISLQEATEYCDYSQEYLSLRARQGKLKAKKFGRNWVTTKEWLDEYLENNGTYNNHNKVEAQKVSFPPENLPIEKIPALRFGFISVLVFVLISAGCVFGKESFKNVYQDLNSIVIEISQSGDFAIKEILNDTKNSYIQIFSLVQKINENLDSHFTTLVSNFSEGLDISAEKLGDEINFVFTFAGMNARSVANDVSSYIYIVGGAGDIIVGNTTGVLFETVSDIPQSFITVSKDINNTIAATIRNMNMGGEEITEGLAAISAPQISLPTISLPKITIGKWFKSQIKEIALGISAIPEVFRMSYFNANKLVEEKIKQTQGNISEGVKAIAEGVAGLFKQKTITEKETIVEKETIKEVEVSKVTKIEPIKEITKETIVTKIDDEELKKLKAQLAGITLWGADIENLREITKKLQANPTYISAPSAPIYVGSQGIQVGGMGNFVFLAVTGSAGISELGVSGSTTLGSNTSDLLTVNAASVFNSSITAQNDLNVAGNIIVTGTVTANGFYTEGGNPIREQGEEMLIGSVSVFPYGMPVQTSDSTQFIRVSKHFADTSAISLPAALIGTTRIYKLAINYADDIAVASTSDWQVVNAAGDDVSESFTLSGAAMSSFDEGIPSLTGTVTIPDTDWQIEVKVPAGKTIRIFQIYLLAYDKID